MPQDCMYTHVHVSKATARVSRCMYMLKAQRLSRFSVNLDANRPSCMHASVVTPGI
jgi:hypothetical protein